MIDQWGVTISGSEKINNDIYVTVSINDNNQQVYIYTYKHMYS
jgi:hypothetical protein